MTKLASLQTTKRLLDRQAADSIRLHILDGRMPPGWRLVETQLADQLAVSRGTVRSALAQLSHEGLVRQVAFTKWEVSGISVVDAWELYTLRGALEALAARLATERTPPAERTRLREILAELVSAVREERFAEATEADFRLHRTIVEMARHRRLGEQHRLMLQQVHVCMIHAGFLPKDYRDLIADHTALVDAVVEGRADEAGELARLHNESEIRLLAAAMSSGAETVGHGGPRPTGA
jgi:DNA-binding GntR family transcriptional regulator